VKLIAFEVYMGGKLFICFLGMDGSGKSTLSRNLRNDLEILGFKASYLWWFNGNNSSIRKFMRYLKSNKLNLNVYLNKHNKPSFLKYKFSKINKTLFKMFYPYLVLIDYLRFGLINAWIPKIFDSSDIIIFDRFMYDVILALSNEFAFTEKKTFNIIELFNKLLPRPDLIFFIDASPEIAYNRKKEELKSIENAKIICRNHKKMYSLVKKLNDIKIVEIDNSHDIESTKEKILKESLALVQ
jgi:thymidylate kinase